MLVEAGFLASPHVFFHAEAAQRDAFDGMVRLARKELAHQVQARAIGQADVADEQVEAALAGAALAALRLLFLGGAERGADAVGGAHAVAHLLQQPRHSAVGVLMVVDEQDLDLAARRLALRACGISFPARAARAAVAARVGGGGDRRGRTKLHGEGRAAPAAGAARRQLPAVQVDQRLADRQAQSQPAELTRHRLIRLLEGVEDLGHRRRVDADAGVGDGDLQRPGGVVVGVDGDVSVRRGRGGELDGVLDQVPEDLLESSRVAAHVVLLRREVHRRAELPGDELDGADVDGAAQGGVHVDGVEVELKFSLADPCQVQQIVDEARFQLDVAADDVQPVRHLRAEIRLSRQRLHRQQHRHERRAQLVGEDR